MFSVVSLSFFTCHLSQMSFLKYLRNIFHPNISPEIYAHWHFIWINIMDVCVGLLLRARPQRLSDPVSQRGWVCMATKELKEKKITALHYIFEAVRNQQKRTFLLSTNAHCFLLCTVHVHVHKHIQSMDSFRFDLHLTIGVPLSCQHF